MTVDLFDPKSTGFDVVSRTATVSSFKSFRSGGFSFYRADIHTHIRRDKVIAISAPSYYIVSADIIIIIITTVLI